MKTCSKCKIEKEDSEFYFMKNLNRLYSWCKPCSCEHNKKVKEEFKLKHGIGHTTAWRRKDPNNIKKCRTRDRNRNQEIKQELISGYGGKCSCCGETNATFLTLEHKNHDGQAHRIALGGSKHSGGVKIYKDVIRQGFPSNYTILCMNCNFAEKDGKLCPHKILRSKEILTFRYFVPCSN